MIYKHLLNLCKFDGEGTASSGEGSTSGETSAVAEQSNGRASKNPLANVQYGVQEESHADSETESTTEVDSATAFDELIKGKYKKEFQDKFQGIFNERFKANKAELEEAHGAIRELLEVTDVLASKYGVDNNNPQALLEALNNDKDMWETIALEKGMTVKQYQDHMRLEKENRELRRSQEQRQARADADNQYNEWVRQANEAKELYPELDLETEVQNEEFMTYLKAGFDVKKAYQNAHFDELMTGGMAKTAQVVSEKMSNNIRARSHRPTENGTSSRSTAVSKLDVSKLTKEDRKEIMRRVERGANIRFS